MPTPILATKLYTPTAADAVSRPRLIERLKEGLAAGRKLTLSSPCRLWQNHVGQRMDRRCGRPVAWLSLDEGTTTHTLSDLPRRGVADYCAKYWNEALAALQSPQPPPTETILTTLLNDNIAFPEFHPCPR